MKLIHRLASLGVYVAVQMYRAMCTGIESQPVHKWHFCGLSALWSRACKWHSAVQRRNRQGQEKLDNRGVKEKRRKQCWFLFSITVIQSYRMLCGF